jgi:FlaA1/EpsC-like NDP-sugar epimerase
MKILSKVFKRTAKTRFIFFFITDIISIVVSVWLAFLLRFEGKIPLNHFLNIQGLIFLALIFSLPTFYRLKLYSFSWAYVSTQELISLLEGTSLSFLFSALFLLIFRDLFWFLGFPRSTLFISYFLIFLFSGAIRFSKRIYLEMFQKGLEEEKERTLIVGAGDAGEQILRSILSSKESSYLPIGFVDDNPIKQGVLIHGHKVFGKISDIPKIVGLEKADNMIVALPSAGSKVIRRAVELGREARIKKIKIIPALSEIIDGQVTIGSLREVQAEDLLGREPLSLDTKSIENFIKDKTVLITGAAGSIGSELCRQVAKFRPSLLFILDQDETGIFNISQELKEKFSPLKVSTEICDICDEKKVEQVFKKNKPNIVFHAAAYKHVPLMEEHPEEAVKNNIFGTKTVAQSALKEGTEKLIFISTDKAVNPSSVMGATKRVGEMLCQALNQENATKFISVRFGNVLESRGSVIPIFREQIKRGGPVQVTHPKMKRYFMTTSEACLLVMQAGAMGQGGEVFVLDMGEPIRILDLAKEMIQLSGFEPDRDIPIVFTQPRPGESFFEEVLTAEEGTVATKHKQIFEARLSRVNRKKLISVFKKLEKGVEKGDKGDIQNTLKELISSYKKYGKK